MQIWIKNQSGLLIPMVTKTTLTLVSQGKKRDKNKTEAIQVHRIKDQLKLKRHQYQRFHKAEINKISFNNNGIRKTL